MRLTVFNGSPRGRKGNSAFLVEAFLDGFTAAEHNSFEMHYLNGGGGSASASAFLDAEAVLLALPLYTDAMPGMVTSFIEAPEPHCGAGGGKPLAFLVQSSFSEALHSRPIERYLEKLAARLGCRYVGTMITGGVGMKRASNAKATRRMQSSYTEIGRIFGETGELDPAGLRRIARPERFSPVALLVLRLLCRTPLVNAYWNERMKRNGAYRRRNDAPYGEPSRRRAAWTKWQRRPGTTGGSRQDLMCASRSVEMRKPRREESDACLEF